MSVQHRTDDWMPWDQRPWFTSAVTQDWVPGYAQGGFMHLGREYLTWPLVLGWGRDYKGFDHPACAWICMPRQMTEKEWSKLTRFLDIYKDGLVMPDAEYLAPSDQQQDHSDDDSNVDGNPRLEHEP